MTSRLSILFPLFFALACERTASRQAVDSSAIARTASTSNTSPAITTEEEQFVPLFSIDGPDSSYGAWDQGGFLSGDHVRHTSGLLIIWLDTAIRATEDHPVGRAHADSIVVTGLKHGEGVGRFCLVNGSMADNIVGIVGDDTIMMRPRLAWLFDKATFRIKPAPTDSVTCLLREPMEEDD
jgi:uncharacterized SAM-binding protein YcdF (DUF218 family)